MEEKQAGTTGHEQVTPMLISLVFLVAAVTFGVYYRETTEDVPFYHWSWYVVTGVQTFFAFVFPILYPGYAVLRYSLGLGNDGPCTRLETFYINSTMGMVMGVKCMALLDHFMFFFTPWVMVLAWMPWPQVQVIASGLAMICGSYMLLWIPPNVVGGKGHAESVIFFSIFGFCSLYRAFDPVIGFTCGHKMILIIFDGTVALLFAVALCRGLSRLSLVKKSSELTQKICTDIGEGPVWQAWPAGQQFPSGWWFEPLPFGSQEGWPYGAWPQEGNSAQPPQDMIDSAAEEMRREMSNFFSAKCITVGIFTLVTAFTITSVILPVEEVC